MEEQPNVWGGYVGYPWRRALRRYASTAVADSIPPGGVSFAVGTPGITLAASAECWGSPQIPYAGTVTAISQITKVGAVTIGVYLNDSAAVSVGTVIAAGDELYFYVEAASGGATVSTINLTITAL
jgi:hypothetical protein